MRLIYWVDIYSNEGDEQPIIGRYGWTGKAFALEVIKDNRKTLLNQFLHYITERQRHLSEMYKDPKTFPPSFLIAIGQHFASSTHFGVSELKEEDYFESLKQKEKH